jgi:hypothetical protein
MLLHHGLSDILPTRLNNHLSSHFVMSTRVFQTGELLGIDLGDPSHGGYGVACPLGRRDGVSA